jgi:hypothetical protein
MTAVLGDLELQAARPRPRPLQRAGDRRREPRVEQVLHRDVDGDRQQESHAAPVLRLREGVGDHALADRAHQARALGGGDEGVRGEQPVLGVAPAHERLHAGERAVQARLGLVAQLELARRDAVAQLADQRQALAAVGVALGPVGPDAGPLALGGVHGDVGVLEQPRGRRPVLGMQGHADAGLDAHRHPVEHERRVQAVAQAPGDRHGRLGFDGPGEQDGELVTAEARQQVVRAQRRLQPRADALQQQVAHVMAERVVELLEAVEVEQQERQRPSAPDVRLEAQAEGTPVGELRELVRQRQAPGLRERAGLAEG